MTDLRYPIGQLTYDPDVTPAKRKAFIQQIAAAPAALRTALAGLTATQLDTPYRPGGWTLRQVAHHVADSHMNAFIRFKLALTEDNPTIRPYNEAEWAKGADVAETPIEVSLALLDALHRRWHVLLESLDEADFRRPLVHPESGPTTVDRLVQMYAWHGRHHTAHAAELRRREGW